MKEVPSFIKWAGGKKQLIDKFKNFLPNNFANYHEPFVGGGSVALYILQNKKPDSASISDTNEELINCYTMIKNNLSELLTTLNKYKKNHSKEQYYKIREIDLSELTPIERAARFIYINKTCFNGLYRVNSKGKFNVPIGSYKNPAIFKEDELTQIHKLLKNVKIINSSFESILNRAEKGDFVYFDPPYYPFEKGKNFTTYTKEKFLEKQQEELSNVFRELDKRGCKLMLSNSDTDFIKKLYKGFNISVVKAKRMINCDATKRGEINEIVVTNYASDQAAPKS